MAGNHTHNHLKRKIKTNTYVLNIRSSAKFINSKLFEPHMVA